MAIPDNLTREHVLAAVADYDAGAPHGFGPSLRYDLICDEKRYPPKAILGLAARHAVGVTLSPSDFSGGEKSKCLRVLRELGFTVVRKGNAGAEVGPPQRQVVAWVFQANPRLYDLDQYLSRHTFIYWNCPKFADQMQVGMPVFLKRSGLGGGIVAKGTIGELPAPKDRVEHPEYLREDLWKEGSRADVPVVGIQLDEVRLSTGEGMLSTSVLESLAELAGHPLVAFRQGTVFRLSAEQAMGLYREWGGEAVPLGQNGGPAVEEGRRLLVTHQRLERSRRLVEDKKQAFRQEHGRLFCEVCRVDHDAVYGALWSERAIEAHHLKPLGDLAGACQTTLRDLLLVCSTCHALIHQSSDVDGNLDRLRRHFTQVA